MLLGGYPLLRGGFDKGYPSDNILFEASQTAVLYQHGEGVMRSNIEHQEQAFPSSSKAKQKRKPVSFLF